LSCNNKDRKIEEGKISLKDASIIYLKPDISKKIYLSDIVKKINFIPLETTEESFLGEINKIEYDDDQYFILNNFDKLIYMFDLNGNFKTRIGRIGDGPGELQYPECFALNRDSKEVWLTNNFHSILKFNYKGEYKESQSINIFFKDFCIYNNYIYLHTSKKANFDNHNKQICYNLWINNIKNEITTYFPYNPILYPNGGTYYDTKIPFCETEGSIIYSYVFSDTIYSIDKNILNLKYIVDFQNRISKKISNLSGEDVMNYLNQNSTNACYLQNVVETFSFLRFNYALNMELYDVFYDKKHKKLIEGKLIDDILGSNLIILYAQDDKFVGYVNAFDVDIQEKAKDFLNEDSLYKLSNMNNDEHNPILFEFELKSIEI
jgi:hypothetical protein